MPDGDVGIFTPTEAAYTRPGTYEKAIRAEATKRGTYLSAMDQFYAELEEMERQFGEKLGFERERQAFEEERWGEELGWMREQEKGRLGLERERLTTQERVARIGRPRAPAGAPGTFPGWEEYMERPEEKAEPEITMDWLSRQLERMYPAATPTTTAAPERDYWQEYIESPAVGMSKGYGYGAGYEY